MPRSTNQGGDVGYTLPLSDVIDTDNVYLSDRGWAYRHYKNAAKTEFWDEVLVAGEVPSGDSPAVFGAASPTFLTGDTVKAPNPTGTVTTIYALSGGSGYSTGTGVATTSGGSGTGLTVDIVSVDGGVIEELAIADAGDGNYVDGELVTVTTGGADATFKVAVIG